MNGYTKEVDGKWATRTKQPDDSWLPIEKDAEGVIIAPQGLVEQLQSDEISTFNNDIFNQIEELEKQLTRPMRELLSTSTSEADKVYAQDKVDTIESEVQALRSQLR